MSKELTPLKAFNNILKMSIGLYKEDVKVVETALKRLEIIDKLNEKHYKETQNKLKALEIIKEKGIIKDCFVGVSLEDYNSSVDFNNTHLHHSYKYLTQEEFDLLKEVLK